VALSTNCLSDGWNGYSVLQHAGGAVGALDVGFVPGPTASPLKDATLVFLLGADEPAIDEIAKEAFVIYQGHHGDKGAARADLILPAAAYTEKSGTYVNTEGRVQRTARALDPPGDARDDWAILVALSKVRGARGAPHLPPPSMHVLTTTPPLEEHLTCPRPACKCSPRRSPFPPQVLGKPLKYETLAGVRTRMADIAPQLGDASGDAVEASSSTLAKLALEYVAPGAPALSKSALVSPMTNFYMTDPVSRASATMAKCVQAYGTRA
jgi:NADH dehydrogenase/NADH:ubiquinone oxidoreductase subunit G